VKFHCGESIPTPQKPKKRKKKKKNQPPPPPVLMPYLTEREVAGRAVVVWDAGSYSSASYAGGGEGRYSRRMTRGPPDLADSYIRTKSQGSPSPGQDCAEKDRLNRITGGAGRPQEEAGRRGEGPIQKAEAHHRGALWKSAGDTFFLSTRSRQ